MSRENVELVRRSIDAFNRHDPDAAVEAMHPEIQWETLDALPDTGTYRGREGVRRFWEIWHEAFAGFHLHLESCAPVDGEQVIATLRVSGEGAGSGVGVESPAFFQVLEIRDEQIVRARMFSSENEAREAAEVGR